ncbi:MAG: tetratricopeptide repeat protein [Bryobacteraceae bacterium]
MNRTAILLLASLALLSAGCEKLKSRDRLNKGLQAYRNARYTDAAEFFKESVALDPKNENGRLYLATAYMAQYIPGAVSPENNQMAKAAKDEFMKVLIDHPKDKIALASLASLAYNQATGVPELEKKFERLNEAKDWYQKLVEADPQSKEGFYSLGVIDWLKTYPVRNTARVKLGMKPEDPGPIKDKKVKEELRQRNLPLVEDGLKDLQKALEIDPNYDDAMAYMNLLYRERADLAETVDGYKKDSDTADQWVQKSLDTKKKNGAKAAAAAAGGINPDAK